MEQSETLINSVIQMPEFHKLDSIEGKTIVVAFRKDLHQKIEQARSFANARDIVRTYGIRELVNVQQKVLDKIKSKVKYATVKEKGFDFKRRYLITEEDVHEYTTALKAHYLKLIAEDKRIGV